MKNSSLFLLCVGFSSLFFVNLLQARSSTWTDLQGTSFKGSPSANFGPFALFSTGGTKGRRVLFRTLSSEDCIRYYEESSKVMRVDDWTHTKSSLSFDLKDRMMRLENGKLVPANLKGVPEPDLYVLIFASAWEEPSYHIPTRFRPTYDRLRRLYGNRLETVFFGIRQDRDGNTTIAKGLAMPWLIANYTEQSEIDVFRQFAPNTGYLMMLVSRDGIPLALSTVENIQAEKKFIDEVSAIAAAGDELNPLFWQDRAHYQSSIRPVEYATSSAPPLLIGNPLRTSALRKMQIKQISANMEIDAEGKVTAAIISNREELPANMVPKLEKALQTATIFVPAIEHGKPVAASYAFNFKVPGDSVTLDIDRDWVFFSARPETVLSSWLLLRPIPVPKQEFSMVDHVDADGVMVMTTVEITNVDVVSKRAQLNAFNSDFFGQGGAASVEPFAGKTEEVDGNKFAWENCASPDGFVDFVTKAANCDYSVGYAWTEIDSPTAGPAYLGIGSDDGVKIWLNGALVEDRWIRRLSRVDDDIVPLQLVAGKNRLLIKIQNASGGWSFLARIRR